MLSFFILLLETAPWCCDLYETCRERREMAAMRMVRKACVGSQRETETLQSSGEQDWMNQKKKKYGGAKVGVNMQQVTVQ